jgi:hypothetical protein
VLWGTILGLQRLAPRTRWLIGALGLHRDTYRALGGALGASGCAAGGFDDWGWARACERAGLRTRMAHHPALLDVSNWSDFRAFWDGLTRWQAGLFTYRRGGWLVALALAATLVCLLAATAALCSALARRTAPEPALWIVASIVPLLGVAYCRWRELPLRFALAFPGVALLVLVALAGAAWARLGNSVRWRDERMAIVSPPPGSGSAPAPRATRQPARQPGATAADQHSLV